MSSAKFVNAVVHSNTTLQGSQTSGSTQLSGSTLPSSLSSFARANLTSSTAIFPSLASSTNFAKQRLTAPSNSFPTSSNSGTHTVSSITQISIPITSLTPTNAAAIADGIAIGGELALLYDKAHSISDLTALAAAKPSIIASIETLKSDLKRLSLDLGGSGIPTCGKSRFRFRSRRRSILDHLLVTIASTVCNLIKVQAEIDAIAPDLVEIAAVWVVIEGLAEVLKEEEKEMEEEEEKEEESQSAEEERASETAKKKTLSTSTRKPSVSTVSSTSVSRTPIHYITELCQPYPTVIDDSAAADNIVLALAAFELSLVFGSSGGGGSGVGLIGNSTSSNSMKSTTGGLTTSITSVPSKIQASAAKPVSEAFISSMSVASAPKAFYSAVSISAASVSRASVSAASMSSASALRASISAASVSALSASVASASRASVSAASILSASASVASASGASVSAASASAASASAAAESFPTQLTSNLEGSHLCKSIGPGPCVSAYSSYNSSYRYTHYTSYVDTAGGFDGEWLGWGCAAMFTCDTDEAYAKGMTGEQILNAFRYLYSDDDVTICGSIYMSNECHLTVNACDLCESSIPCESLPEQFQPPHGDVPCYFDDGTTWPPTPPPVNGCGSGLDKRRVC